MYWLTKRVCVARLILFTWIQTHLTRLLIDRAYRSTARVKPFYSNKANFIGRQTNKESMYRLNTYGFKKTKCVSALTEGIHNPSYVKPV